MIFVIGLDEFCIVGYFDIRVLVLIKLVLSLEEVPTLEV
jgi:hypothetical protein